jgi:SAM-dependent methyltransferase
VEERYYSEYYEVEDRHWWFVGRRRIFERVLDRRLGPAPGRRRRILDVGCGTGTMLHHLARYGDAEGVDADARAVALCHRRGLERVRQAELPLPWGDGTFDLVTALDVLEHADDDTALLRELRRVTRPGGMVMVSVPAFRWLWGPQDEISHHRRRYTARELERRVRDSRLELCHLSYFNTLLFPPIAAVRLLRPHRAGSRELRSDFELTRPGRLNDLLGRVFGAEARAVERLRLPVGVSILALARRGEAE